MSILQQVKADACVRFHIGMQHLEGRNRSQEYVRARRYCWRRLRKAGWSWPRIGKAFDRHHTTIIYVCNGRDKERK